MNAAGDLYLLFGSLCIGRITDPFCDQGTWFGKFEPASNLEDSDCGKKILEFIAFCKDWNERAAETAGANALEFDRFGAIVCGGFWATETSAATRSQICDAPNFFAGDDVSWIYDSC
jgi:hypothetical protein